MTFGEFLSGILISKHISVTRLAELTGTKSRNSIQRLLKDQSSIHIIESFKSKLLESDPLRLSRPEREQMEQSVEVSRAGKDTFEARKIMLQVFDNGSHRVNSEIPTLFNPHDQTFVSLRNLFATYQTFAKIKILILDAISPLVTIELLHLIRTSPSDLVSVEQILYLGNSRSRNAEAFASVCNLFNHQQYDVYNIRPDMLVTSDPQISSPSMIIGKEAAGGDHYADLIKMDANRNLSFISNVPGPSLYDFYAYHFEQIKMTGEPVKRGYKNQNPLETVLSICETCLEAEKNSARYLVKHSFSSSMIPYDIFLKILTEADYYGLSPNSPITKRLNQVLRQRIEAFSHTDKLKVNFLTKRGLLDFVQNRVMSDHFCHARPFTREEVKRILTFNLQRLDEDKFFKILLLKNDYSIANLEFSYYENKMLWIFDSYSGYGQDYYEGFIESTPILDVFDDFIKNQLLHNHTLPESETVDFFKYLLHIADSLSL